MSLRRLYNSIPIQARHCTWCHNQIERNIATTPDGRLWHYGCLNDAKDTHYECVECFSRFDGTEACLEEIQSMRGDDFTTGRKASCPNCGSSDMKGLSQAGVIET
jgi:DNA-directed RNA polymerase subunit RPC12/RpoP